jgi:hypothetical protein
MSSRCGEAYECGYAAGCLFMKTDREVVECYRPCMDPIMEYDPVLIGIGNLLTCFGAKCRDVCAVDPAG